MSEVFPFTHRFGEVVLSEGNLRVDIVASGLQDFTVIMNVVADLVRESSKELGGAGGSEARLDLPSPFPAHRVSIGAETLDFFGPVRRERP